jgi:hypothetical protein
MEGIWQATVFRMPIEYHARRCRIAGALVQQTNAPPALAAPPVTLESLKWKSF